MREYGQTYMPQGGALLLQPKSAKWRSFGPAHWRSFGPALTLYGLIFDEIAPYDDLNDYSIELEWIASERDC